MTSVFTFGHVGRAARDPKQLYGGGRARKRWTFMELERSSISLLREKRVTGDRNLFRRRCRYARWGRGFLMRLWDWGRSARHKRYPGYWSPPGGR